MKILKIGKEYSRKTNFVDINNVFVGFDTHQDCCENAGYFISPTEDNEPKEDEGIKNGLEDYVFDPDYFVDVVPKQEGSDYYKYSCLEDGGMVRFRLICQDKCDLYLHLYNSHNGYYSHGFEFKVDNITKQEGSI